MGSKRCFRRARGYPSAGLRLVRALVLGAMVVGASGCYQTAPLASPQPAPGTRVYARLTPQGSSQMAPWLGEGISAVEGIVIQTEPERWQMSMLRVEQVRGGELAWNRESVSFPTSAFGAVHERRFQRERSFLAAGAIAVGAILLGRVFVSDVFGGGDDDGEPPPPPQ